MNKNFHNTSVRQSTYEKIAFLANAQNKSIAKFLDDLVCPFFQVGMNFSNANMESCISILSSSVTYTFSGKTTFRVGQIPEAQLKKDMQDMFEKVHRDVAEAKKKLNEKVVKK